MVKWSSMEAYLIGSILKEYRTRFKISQEELCFDLCAVSTLSRIENGSQIPGRKLIESLFSRLGMNPPASSIPMTKTDFKRENLEYEIIDKLANNDFNIFQLLEEYKSCGNELDLLEEQFFRFFKSYAEDKINHEANHALKEFIEALHLTLKDYKIGLLPKAKLLTKTELIILNNIARMLYFTNQKEHAINLMEFLRSYFENGIVSEEEKAKNYPVILFNLENWYGLKGEGQKSLELSEKGINACIQYGKLTQFPYQIFNKGYALNLLGKRQEAEKYISDAFTIFKQMKKYEEAKFGAETMNKEFGFSFPIE